MLMNTLWICEDTRWFHIYKYPLSPSKYAYYICLFPPSSCTGMKKRRRGGVQSGRILIKQGLCVDSVLCIRQKVKQMPGQRCHFKQWLLALESASCLLRKHSPFRLLIASQHGVCVCVCVEGYASWGWGHSISIRGWISWRRQRLKTHNYWCKSSWWGLTRQHLKEGVVGRGGGWSWGRGDAGVERKFPFKRCERRSPSNIICASRIAFIFEKPTRKQSWSVDKTQGTGTPHVCK